MEKYIPEIGDVVIDNDIPVVVVKMINYEDCDSCSYDRKYLLCDESFFERSEELVTISTLEKVGRWVTIQGDFPDIQKADVAPYDIKMVEAFSIRQKKAKIITVYE
ncbi:hypothetical protein FYJ38_00545 [Clostridium sp. WB02_MRS01]|uniref:hypothetical protein n=1 Tax=Clostridium sp. WB02_MRS01 TaxID=2605777 RepID=UPI0012B25761|nr:hypothetical protein [Clostridium sp. WB02_MRS01]MSS07128.1 hypothetical protein [Clostridium sp. WB02_MRS01]